ncbi:aminoglycoside phosphotransferase family protein [Nocardioides pelophilus]|uniref:aminoglycoside phosphotransferase family protein n=1 Tax=Nocardioides pelophilus TaxID=2172019 RepID=UPI00160326ED|nr:aminoglycoside phosphotransferase family protein [Nocardioides pelophilus]
MLTIPPGLDRQRSLGPEWAAWLDRLPGLVGDVVDGWELQLDGPLWHGFCSLVAPVHTPAGAEAVLKIGLPDDESEHEHLALQRWRGRGVVRLLRADPARRALLLERLDRVDLSDPARQRGETRPSIGDQEACEIVAGLYPRLHVPPMPQLREQASYVRRWAAAVERDADAVPVPRRLVEQALALAGDLCAEPPTAVIHGDLHYENVLLGERGGEPTWLAIDPKPANGDPHYEIEPMLRNRFEEYGDVGSVRDGIRRRFHILVDAAGLDEERARDWVVVRSILDAHWAFADAVRADRAMSVAERDHVTRCITVAKAVQG